jgi:hypothetical protein
MDRPKKIDPGSSWSGVLAGQSDTDAFWGFGGRLLESQASQTAAQDEMRRPGC